MADFDPSGNQNF